MTGFDWDVVRRSLSCLFLDGMRFTLPLTLLAAAHVAARLVHVLAMHREAAAAGMVPQLPKV